MLAPCSGCLDLGKCVVTSLRMSRSWKKCCRLTPDVSILERVSVTGPGCIREGFMSCMVMSTNVSMSTYVSCAGMSRRTYGSCENCVYKEGCLPCFVFFFSSYNLLYSIRNINFISVSSVSSVSTVSPYRQRSSSTACPCPTRPSDVVRSCPTRPCDTVRLSGRHVHPTLSVSLSDSSVQHCPSSCPTRPYEVVRSCPTHPSDAVRLCLPFLFPFPFPFPFPLPFLFPFLFPSRSHFRSRSIAVPVPVSPPRSCLRHQNSPEYLGEPPPLQIAFSITNPEVENFAFQTIYDRMLFAKLMMQFSELAMQVSRRPVLQLPLGIIGQG